MRCTELLVVVLNEQSPARMARAIRRACEYCATTSQALVLELRLGPPVLTEVRHALLGAMRSDQRPLALSVVVEAPYLEFARAVSLELAFEGKILGEFVRRSDAERHALRERGLAVLDCIDASASSVRSVKSISAKARA